MAEQIAFNFNPYIPRTESEQRRRVLSLLREGYERELSAEDAARVALAFLIAQGKPRDFRILPWLMEEPALFQPDSRDTLH